MADPNINNLKTDFVNGDILNAGTITNTSGVNAMTAQINRLTDAEYIRNYRTNNSLGRFLLGHNGSTWSSIVAADGIYQTTNNGFNYSARKLWVGSPFTAARSQINRNHAVVAFVSGGQIQTWTTTDAGSSWTQGGNISNIPTIHEMIWSTTSGIVICGSETWAGNHKSMAYSYDAGATWNNAVNGPGSPTGVISLGGFGSNIWGLDRTGSAWKSTDVGSSWTAGGYFSLGSQAHLMSLDAAGSRIMLVRGGKAYGLGAPFAYVFDGIRVSSGTDNNTELYFQDFDMQQSASNGEIQYYLTNIVMHSIGVPSFALIKVGSSLSYEPRTSFFFKSPDAGSTWMCKPLDGVTLDATTLRKESLLTDLTDDKMLLRGETDLFIFQL